MQKSVKGQADTLSKLFTKKWVQKSYNIAANTFTTVEIPVPAVSGYTPYAVIHPTTGTASGSLCSIALPSGKCSLGIRNFTSAAASGAVAGADVVYVRTEVI